VRRYDVVLIGGGVIGSSVAMALGERGLKTAVVDIDLSGRLSSSEKNAGGVRACARTLRARRAGAGRAAHLSAADGFKAQAARDIEMGLRGSLCGHPQRPGG
jgi:glycine/D-amino acid oxidase-like deaminating enzyme